MFANPHLENELVPGRRGNLTMLMPEADDWFQFSMPAWPICRRGVPSDHRGRQGQYGGGSSRDWAAKGVRHLGVCAVLAESFETIHRANLINVGVLPLRFPKALDRMVLKLDRHTQFRLRGLRNGITLGGMVGVDVLRRDGAPDHFAAALDVVTQNEIDILRAGGLLPMLIGTILADAEGE